VTRIAKLRAEFVDRIPKGLSDGVIYISMKYATAAHNCCCGCGIKVMTPFKPGRWRLERHGARVSLHPSIGNWSLPCKSHYWICDNTIQWAPSLTSDQIAVNRANDRAVLRDAHARRAQRERGFWRRTWEAIKTWFGRHFS
jgi:hypothetical protein